MKLSMKTAGTTALAALTLTLALTTSGCGKTAKTDGTTTTSAAAVTKRLKGSCNLRSQASTCSEETDASDPMDLAKGLCDALKGTWSEGTCPKDNIVGTCLDKDGSTTSYYADGEAPRDLDDAKSSCETISEGKFTAIAAPKPAATAAAATSIPAAKGGGKSAKKK
jgi:hypothetical protein